MTRSGWAGGSSNAGPPRTAGQLAGQGAGASTVKWGTGLQHVPDVTGEYVEHFRRLAVQATEELPMNEALRERLIQAVTRLRGVQEASGAWFTMVSQSGNSAGYFDAYNNPRGGLHTEAKSDTDRAH